MKKNTIIFLLSFFILMSNSHIFSPGMKIQLQPVAEEEPSLQIPAIPFISKAFVLKPSLIEFNPKQPFEKKVTDNTISYQGPVKIKGATFGATLFTQREDKPEYRRRGFLEYTGYLQMLGKKLSLNWKWAYYLFDKQATMNGDLTALRKSGAVYMIPSSKGIERTMFVAYKTRPQGYPDGFYVAPSRVEFNPSLGIEKKESGNSVSYKGLVDLKNAAAKAELYTERNEKGEYSGYLKADESTMKLDPPAARSLFEQQATREKK